MTSSAVPTIDALIASFPHPTIPPIVGRPNYETIAAVAKLLNANAALVPTENAGGAHGHLAITVSPAVYATLCGTPWVDPPNPGAFPAIPAGATAAQIRVHERTHATQLRAWRLHTAVEGALKQQLIGAVDPIFLSTVQDRYTGFSGTTIRALLDHLYARFGNITTHELAQNDEHMRTPYAADAPIEQLFEQINNATRFADAGGQLYTNQQIVNTAYNLIAATGQFVQPCREWRARAAADKTWAAFQQVFAQAWLDLQADRTITAAAQGFQAANLATAAETWANETAAAFADLASATAADRSTLASVIATNTELASQLAAHDRTIADLRSQLANQRANPTTRQRTTPSNSNYCWTHGWVVADDHTSQSCSRPAEGHQRAATRADTKGGSNRNKDRALRT